MLHHRFPIQIILFRATNSNVESFEIYRARINRSQRAETRGTGSLQRAHVYNGSRKYSHACETFTPTREAFCQFREAKKRWKFHEIEDVSTCWNWRDELASRFVCFTKPRRELFGLLGTIRYPRVFDDRIDDCSTWKWKMDVKEETPGDEATAIGRDRRQASLAGTLGRADKRYRRIAQTLVATGCYRWLYLLCGTRDGAKTRARFVICAARRVAV